MTLQWTPDLATGVQKIDDQHKELFRRVDMLISAWDAGKAAAEVEQTVKFLGDYVVEHFGTEEQYMKQFTYGSSGVQHMAQHAVFIDIFGKLKQRYMKEGTTPEFIEDTRRTVVDWLKNHIKYSDKALGLFLKTRI